MVLATAHQAKHGTAGFSLVELMVGMVLGLMLIAGAVSIYLASKQSYVEVEQVGALSENARFAEQVLGDALRHAGFLGEVPANRIELDSNLTDVVGDCAGLDGLAGAHNLTQFVFAATADGGGDAMGCIDDAAAGTDVLVIKHAVPQPLTDGPREGADPNDPTQTDGVISAPRALQANRTYIITNNIGGRMFDGADTAPTIDTGGEFPGGAAWEYQYEVFYIRDRVPGSDTDSLLLSRKFLFWNGAAMELRTEDLVEGVERLRLLFGIDSDDDGDVDTYQGQATMSADNWANVESVEVYMLVRSATPDPQYSDAKTYLLGDLPPISPADTFRRLVSYTSVSIRNLKLIIRGGA